MDFDAKTLPYDLDDEETAALLALTPREFRALMSERHQVAFTLRCSGQNYVQVGAALGISKSRASILVREALGKALSPLYEERHARELKEKKKNPEDGIVAELFSVRTSTTLEAFGVRTLFQLADKTEGELLRFKHQWRRFGRKDLKEVKEVLDDHGLQLRERPRVCPGCGTQLAPAALMQHDPYWDRLRAAYARTSEGLAPAVRWRCAYRELYGT